MQSSCSLPDITVMTLLCIRCLLACAYPRQPGYDAAGWRAAHCGGTRHDGGQRAHVIGQEVNWFMCCIVGAVIAGVYHLEVAVA